MRGVLFPISKQRLLLSVLFCTFLCLNSVGQSYLFAELKGSPVNTTGWNLDGAAVTNNSEILICPANNYTSGAVFYGKPIDLTFCNKWTVEFDFRINDGTVADGLAFCFLDVPPTGFVNGQGLGIPDKANGLKVCFDTYANCPPQNPYEFPKIELRWGTGYNECWPQPTLNNVNGSLDFLRTTSFNRAKVTYDKGNIKVYVNGKEYLSGFQEFNFVGYMGFTASTGIQNDNHTIKNVTIYTNLPPSEAGYDKIVCSGQSVQIGTTPDQQNFYNWSPATGLNSPYVANPEVRLQNTSASEITQKYYVQTSAISSPGCASIDSVTITVKPVAPISVSIKASETNICSGSKVLFTADAKNISSKASYQWKVNDVNVGENSSSFTSTSLLNGDKVSCVIKDVNECDVPLSETSNVINIEVTPNPLPSITISASATTICQGTPVSFTATAQNGGTDPKYQWKVNGVDVGTSSFEFSSSTLKDGDKVECVLTSNSACVADPKASSNIITMEANKPVTPSITISASATTICQGTPVSFTATAQNGGTDPKYQWKVNGVDVGTSSFEFSSSTLKDGDKVECVLTSNSACVADPKASSNIITMEANKPVTPSITISASATTICQGTPVSFTATAQNGGTDPKYQWKVNGVDVGTSSFEFSSSTLKDGDKVECVLTSNSACVADPKASSNIITMEANKPVTPSITISASATTICQGTPVSFTATAQNGGTDPKYQWKVNGVDVGTSSFEFSSSTLKDGDKVECVLTSNSACVADPKASSNIITMEANKPVTPSITISASATTICQGTPVSFTATAQNGGTDPKYQWKVNGKKVGTNSPSYSSNKLSNGDQVVCEFSSVINDCSNNKSIQTTKASVPVTIVINPLPVISVSPADTMVKLNSQIKLNASVNGTFQAFKWSDESTLVNPSSLTPLTRPLRTKTEYQLEVITNDGCVLRKNVNIKIANKLLMPNAFTPNGDGKNDIYRVPPEVVFQLKKFSVFNRWGNLVFYTEDISKGWDGRLNGVEQPVGVYIYVVEGTDETGPVFLKGTATLIR